VRWIRNTIKKVMTVVPVFITSCQVFEKSNKGPVISQIIMHSNATMKAPVVPVKSVESLESLSNTLICFLLFKLFMVVRILF